MIAAHLPLASAASLAFSCRFMRYILGQGYWLDLREPGRKAEKLEFLRLLDFSLPLHVICVDCAVYHRRYRFGRAETVQYPAFEWHGPYCLTNKATVRFSPHVRIAWWQVQLAMRAHRLSPRHGTKLKALSLDHGAPSEWKQTTTRAAVVDGHLLIRVRTILPIREGPSFMQKLEKELVHRVPSCVHYPTPSWLSRVCLRAVRQIPRDKKQRAHHAPYASCHQCSDCLCVYSVELQLGGRYPDSVGVSWVNKRRHLLVVSLWADFGAWESTASREWQALTGQKNMPSSSGCSESVQTQFENAAGSPIPRAYYLTKSTAAGELVLEVAHPDAETGVAY